MTRQQAERNIRLYYLFQLFKEPLFWGAILITFINRVSGMTLADIYFMEAACVIGIVILDSPFGALADLIGRRNTMFIGMCVWSIKLFVFASAVNPLMIWSANLLWVLGAALITGADTSMLADSLKFLGRDREFQKIEGRSNAYRLALTAVCAISIGYLAEINLRLPVYLGVPFMLISCVAAYLMVEPPVIAGKTKNRQEYFKLLKLSALFIYNHAKIKWIIAFSTLIAVISKLWFFTYNPYFELVNLPITCFGWIFCLLNIVAAISSHEAHRFAKYFGEFGSVVIMIALIALPIWLMGAYVGQLMVLMVLMQNVVRGYMIPFLGGFLHQHLDSENRATVTSLKSTVNNVGQFIALAIFGLILNTWSLPVCLQILGVSTLLIGLVLIFSFRRIFLTPAKP